MADKLKTTSSKSSEQKQQASPARPNAREVELMTHLAANINESYKMVKQRQQKLYDLTNSTKFNSSSESSVGWQDVCSPKNKLKRKKTLSASLTSVTDSVNQEKRTRIEGIQLNCRGKLNFKENLNSSPLNSPEQMSSVQQHKLDKEAKQEKLVSKPPLPPQASKASNSENQPPKVSTAPPPPRLKRKLQENVQTIQKLNALTEQLRLEINELKSNLTTEKGAVRVLRAQNEAETRKWKNEVKKLQNSVEFLKKSGANKKSENAPTNADNLNLPHQAAVGGLVNYEIQRLTNEINALKEANKALEEKKVINCDADRRKAADIRELKDSYEIRLTQIQKSAKTEISRLLEEIKTKERNIGQLKKDLQTIQNTRKTSRNATIINSTNKTTTLNSNKKPKNSNNKISNNSNNSNQVTTTPVNAICCCNCNGIVIQSQKHQQQQQQQQSQILSKRDNSCQDIKCPSDEHKDVSTETDFSIEISKLKNIELINNTRNVTTNLQRSNKILSTRDDNDSISINPVHKQLKALEIPDDHNDCVNVIHKNADQQQQQQQQQQQFATLLTTTHLTKISTPPSASTSTSSAVSVAVSSSSSSSAPTVIDASSEMSPMTSVTPAHAKTSDVTDHFEERNLTQELAQHLSNTKAIEDAKQSDLHNHNHSDSDSALSSAPPSISPQPPANGIEPTDIWQTIRSYTNDIEKLQKEVDSLQKENEKLQQELHVAKDHIMDMENAAMKNNNNDKYQQLLERIKYLEDQEHQLEAEANDLREQNELLEFRILEFEDTTDKWSLHSASNPTADETHNDKNLWSCPADVAQGAKSNPFEMLFRSNSHRSTTNSLQPDSGIISPQSQGANDELIDVTHDDLCRRLGDLLKKASLEDEEKHCLQHVLHLMQQLDALTPRSGPDSLNATQCCGEESSSMDMVKSRNSEYSSSSSPPSSIRSSYEKSAPTKTAAPSSTLTTGRIVATVQPYNSTPSSSLGSSPQIVPHNTPTDSPRKTRSHHWQNNSLSESGVFVESDFLSDSGENNACTQTDFEEFSSLSGTATTHQLALNAHIRNVPAHFSHLHQVHKSQSPNLSDQKRLQFYKERLEILEGKIQIYESSGDVQAKRLAERLQREILLEKEVKELRDRVDFLESENASLEEEKCEFEEAENDTRLRLQRLEVELEILSQRNVELDMSREALSAKYKDCHSECLILRDDIATSETHIRHLEEDKQKAKENFEFLHNILPVILVCNTICTLKQAQASTSPIQAVGQNDMGNQLSALSPVSVSTGNHIHGGEMDNDMAPNAESCSCQERELQYLKEEVKCLRHQIKELNSRHYAAMESADSHWVDLEREYKEREEQFRAKEMCLKLKIQKLQDCLREDARSANEKICQLEEAEQGLKTCLVRVSKEHQKLLEDHQCLVCEFERFKEQHDQLREQQKPLTEALETEKKRNKGLIDELTFMRKLQHETEIHSKAEFDSVRTQMFDLKKEYLHIEVTNGELREEVATLELQVETLQQAQRDCEEKVRCLTDEIRTKDEICQKLEKRLERSEGYSLADELGDTPSKRFKREDVKDLQTASKGLGNALRHMNDCERMLPTQKQFQTVARDVKKLADTLLNGEIADEEVSIGNQDQEIPNPYEQATEETIAGEEVKTEDVTIKRESIRVESETTNNDSPMVGQKEPQFSDMAFGSPLATSSPIKHQSMENISSAIKEEIDDEQTLVVGMALVPQVFVDESLLPSCSHEQKKVICEVPSELRKLSKPLHMKQLPTNQSHSADLKKRGKRCAKRRLTRGRINTLHTRVRHIISSMNAFRLYQDVSDLDICASEVLQRNFSYSSFHSLRDEATESSLSKKLENELKSQELAEEPQPTLSHTSFRSLADDVVCVASKSVDAFTECEIITEMIDTETETCVEKRDSSIQVDEEIQPEIRLPSAPAHIICFLSMLKTSVAKSDIDINVFNQKLSKHWELNVEFREGLELLSTLAGFRSDHHKSPEVSLSSYENFVKALSDLHSLQELFKPLASPMLMQIEEQVNECLMNFHNRKMESEFYCTVYYPVNRPSSRVVCPNFHK